MYILINSSGHKVKNMCLILTVTCIPPRKCWAHPLVLWNIGQATNGQDNIVGWQTSCMEKRIRSKQGMVDVELRKKSVALRASWVKKMGNDASQL